jgi:hypothetical protein
MPRCLRQGLLQRQRIYEGNILYTRVMYYNTVHF